MNYDQAQIPIACRFVASDQWLTTYFDSTCKISYVKQYILAKVYNKSVPDNDDQPSRNRPVSPITFASARSSFDSTLEGSLQDGHIIDLDPYLFSEPIRQPRTPRQPLSQRVASPSSAVPRSLTEQRPFVLPAHHYPMLAFSTGQLLEDDCSLAWYRLRPHELLELHPPGTIVRFPRDVMLEYIKPYLELDVRALRVIVKDKDVHAFGPTYAGPDAPSPGKNKKPKDLAPDCSTTPGGSASPASQSTRKRRKTRLEWRDRYLVIRQGMLSLFKSRTDLTPVHTCSLAKLTTLRGKEEIAHTTTAAMPSPHIICAKFCADASTLVLPDSQPVTSPMAEQWNDPWSGGTIPRETDGFFSRGKRESKEDIKQQRRSTVEGNQQLKANPTLKEDLFESRTPDGKGECLRYDINIGDGTQGTWLVLDTLDELAHENLLRVLHRCSPDTINTTLIPKFLLPDSSFSSPSSHASSHSSQIGAPSRTSCRYPEWRIEVSRRAQQSGLGSVGDAMGWVLCGGPPLEPPVPKITNPELHRKISDITTDDPSTAHEPFDFDADDDDGENGNCEFEWDSWAEDLMRQALAHSSNDIAVTITEPLSIPASYPDKRIRPTVSSSTFSSVTLSEQGSRLPSDILPGANLGLLSVDSPALLTAPSVLPFQSTGTTTSTVSAGGVVRTRSLITVDGRRGRGVARAMEVLSEDGDDDGPFMGKRRMGRQKDTREDNGRGAMASSAPSHSSMVVPSPTANTITSTVTVRESIGTPSPPPVQFRGSAGPFYAEGFRRVGLRSPASASALMSASTSTSTSPPLSTAACAATDASSSVSETASVRPEITTMTTTTRIQLLPRRSSAGGEMMLPEASSSSPSQRGSDKVEKKGKQPKNSSSRGKVFRPERLVSKLDSALDFVTG